MDKVYMFVGHIVVWACIGALLTLIWFWFKETIIGDFLITVLWGHRKIKNERIARFLVDAFCKPSGTLSNKINRRLIKHYMKKYRHTELYNEMCQND